MIIPYGLNRTRAKKNRENSATWRGKAVCEFLLMISLGQSLEEIAPKEEEPVAQQEEVALTVVPSTTSTAAESLASENSAATSAGSSQESVQPSCNPKQAFQQSIRYRISGHIILYVLGDRLWSPKKVFLAML